MSKYFCYSYCVCQYWEGVFDWTADLSRSVDVFWFLLTCLIDMTLLTVMFKLSKA